MAEADAPSWEDEATTGYYLPPFALSLAAHLAPPPPSSPPPSSQLSSRRVGFADVAEARSGGGGVRAVDEGAVWGGYAAYLTKELARVHITGAPSRHPFLRPCSGYFAGLSML